MNLYIVFASVFFIAMLALALITRWGAMEQVA
jgi:hypothetical protein